MISLLHSSRSRLELQNITYRECCSNVTTMHICPLPAFYSSAKRQKEQGNIISKKTLEGLKRESLLMKEQFEEMLCHSFFSRATEAGRDPSWGKTSSCITSMTSSCIEKNTSICCRWLYYITLSSSIVIIDASILFLKSLVCRLASKQHWEITKRMDNERT